MLSRTTHPLVLLDVTRLIGGSRRPIPTGIERVENAYAQWLLAEPSVRAQFVLTGPNEVRLIDDEFVRPFLKRQSQVWSEGPSNGAANAAMGRINRFLAADPEHPRNAPGGLRRPAGPLLDARDARAGQPKERRLQPLLQRVLSEWAHKPVAPFLKHARHLSPLVYLRVSPDRMESIKPFAKLRAAAELKVMAFCHDLIPMLYPEFVRPGASQAYAKRIDTLARIADGVVVSTDHVGACLRQHVPHLTAPILTSPIGLDRAEPVRLEAVVDAPFFLVVSTIEARKNHAMLLQIWRRFVAELGSKAPKLVIIGKRGWEAHFPLAMLDRADELRPFVYEAGAVPSATLVALRQKAVAVLMPSLAEGFGLPVAEALADGTPVIASDIPAFREIAGGAADLLDPLDGPSWASTILSYLDASTGRRAAAVRRAAEYDPPVWSAHFAAVRQFMDDLITRPGPGSLPLLADALAPSSRLRLPRPAPRHA